VGRLVDGRWQAGEVAPTNATGQFVRTDAKVRNWITPDGSAGPTGRGGFTAASGRYHLYVSLACPWASRALIMRAWKGLSPHIGLSVTHWLMGEQGWTFLPADGVEPDPLHHVTYLHELYTRDDPHYTGKVTVPVLWDKQTDRMVNNESADIIRMFNDAFDGVGAADGDYYPTPLRSEIDTINARVYETLNDGVYRAGFAKTQEAYEAAVVPLFETLDWLERRLAHSRFLVGEQPTEADVRLFTTLVRFDGVYHGHFKCNLRRVIDYPNLWAYARDLYQWPNVAETVDFTHIKYHYYVSHTGLNPRQIVPIGPLLDWNAPVKRELVAERSAQGSSAKQ
jgi:glutathionyl-hydroquinone reductase